MSSVCIILGTRPEIVKMSPVIREYQERGQDFFVIHSGQHYSYNMDAIFFKELELEAPKYNIGVGSGKHGAQTGTMLAKIEEILIQEVPGTVLVQGDTNTVLAGSLAAVKLGIKVGHVEAGMRSFDRTMPEEINRVLVDHMADINFAPNQTAITNLVNEGIPAGKIVLSGNTLIDAVIQGSVISEAKSRILDDLKLERSSYVLATIHRQENVDNRTRLANIIAGVSAVAVEQKIRVVLPLHPHTKRSMTEYGIAVPDAITIIEPLGFMDFLRLESNAKLIMTDSGGIQEEACALMVPCVTMRDNTEWIETLEIGSNMLAGADTFRIAEAARAMIDRPRDWACPIEGRGSGRLIVDYVQAHSL